MQKYSIVAKKIRELALANPNTIYQRPVEDDLDYPDHDGDCSYIRGECTNGTTGCIVGQVLLGMGVSVEELEAREGNAGGDVIESVFDLTTSDQVSRSLWSWVNSIQKYQDMGKTWGFALAKADADNEMIAAGEVDAK